MAQTLNPSAVSERTQAAPARASIDDCIRAFEREFDYVLRTLQRMGASPADAQDLTQEVFLVMWRRREDWNPHGPLRPWLAAIAFRVALAHRRRSLREVPAGLLDPEDGTRAVDDQLSSAWARRTVLETLSALPPKQRAVLVMHELDGVSMKQIASALGLPLFTAYSRLRVARQRFAKEVRRREQLAAVGRMNRLSERNDPARLPALLLDLERPIPAAPAGLKRRVLAGLPGLAPEGSASGETPATSGWAPIGSGTTLVTAGLALVAALALFVGAVRHTRTADASQAATRSGVAAGETPALAVALRLPSITPDPSAPGRCFPRCRCGRLRRPGAGGGHRWLLALR